MKKHVEPVAVIGCVLMSYCNQQTFKHYKQQKQIQDKFEKTINKK